MGPDYLEVLQLARQPILQYGRNPHVECHTLDSFEERHGRLIRDARLCGRCQSCMDGGWEFYQQVPAEILNIDSHRWPGPSTYVTRWHHLHVGRETGEGLSADIDVEASSDQIQHALHLNFNCLTQWGGCSGIDELFPDVARDYKHFVDCMSATRSEEPQPPCE
jgi:hypothetical protein